jgi:hypothetical protein
MICQLFHAARVLVDGIVDLLEGRRREGFDVLEAAIAQPLCGAGDLVGLLEDTQELRHQ